MIHVARVLVALCTFTCGYVGGSRFAAHDIDTGLLSVSMILLGTAVFYVLRPRLS